MKKSPFAGGGIFVIVAVAMAMDAEVAAVRFGMQVVVCAPVQVKVAMLT